jgi:hypothetical protein
MAAFKIPKAVWGVPFDDFMGPTMIGDNFAFDGRDEDHDVFFDAGYEEKAVWKSDDGEYAIHSAGVDFEPPATVMLVHKATCVGFYAAGQSWIDVAHRGKGLSPQMVLAACVLAKGVPFDNESPFGFSPAGYAAHEAAHRIAVRMAIDAGKHVPSEVREQYEETISP